MSSISACRRSGAETIRRAAAVHPIADLQIEYSLISRGLEEKILPAMPRTRHRHHRLRRAVARPDQRPLEQRPARREGLSQHEPAFPGRQSRPQPRSGRGAAQGRGCQGRVGRADRHRLGGGAGRRHHSAGRRPPPRPSERSARRAGGYASTRPILRPSTRPCRRELRPATAMRLTRWPRSTAKKPEKSRPPAGTFGPARALPAGPNAWGLWRATLQFSAISRGQPKSLG